MGIYQSLPLAVVAALAVVLVYLRSRWVNSQWRSEQLNPVDEIDELVRIMSGLHRRATRRGDPRNAAITKWVAPFVPMMAQWREQKLQLKKQASFLTWLKCGMPSHLIPDYRSATLQLHARSAVAPILAQFNAGPVELVPSLGDDVWRALNVDLPEPVLQSASVPRLSQSRLS